jgi:hypothetical protein
MPSNSIVPVDEDELRMAEGGDIEANMLLPGSTRAGKSGNNVVRAAEGASSGPGDSKDRRAGDEPVLQGIAQRTEIPHKGWFVKEQIELGRLFDPSSNSLTAGVNRELFAVWSQLDTSRDGYLDRQEFSQCVHPRVVAPPPPCRFTRYANPCVHVGLVG